MLVAWEFFSKVLKYLLAELQKQQIFNLILIMLWSINFENHKKIKNKLIIKP